MFDDEKELNTRNTNEGTQQAEENAEQPEYVNYEDADTQHNSEQQSYYNGQSGDNNSTYYNGQSSNNNQSYYNGQSGDNNSTYYNGQSSNNNQSYYNGQNNDNNQSYYSGQNYYDYNSGAGNSNNNGKKKGNKGAAIIAAVAVAAIVLVGGILVVVQSMDGRADKVLDELNNPEASTKEAGKEYPTIGSTVSGDNDNKDSTDVTGVRITDVSDVVSDVMPSIVAITSTTIVESNTFGNDWFFGSGFGYGDNGPQEYEEVGAGSGIIVKQTDTELLIVTNNHVVAGADSLSILFDNGKSIDGVTKSTDEDADIAIVSIALKDIDNDTLNSIKIATLGNSDELKVGEGVVAIGNALGYGQSVTTGVISAKDREIAVDNNTMVVLQTDAAINGGNSGGALINSKGEVIGINVAKYSSSSYSGSASIEGMGFAIPISQATEIMNNLMTKQTRTKVDEKERGVLGIKGVTVTSENSQMYALPEGVFINEIIKGGAAEKAGLQVSDVITKFDGQGLSSLESLQDKLQYYKAGETVTITIQRNVNGVYQEKEVELILSSSNIIDNETTQQR